MSWNDPDAEDTTTYKVLLNHEEQYSIWPSQMENPLGWRDAGKTGTKAECLAYIKEVWTDMRPLSLRKAMEEAAQRPAVEQTADSAEAESAPPEPTLVERLSSGNHPVEVSIRPERSVQAFKECLDRGYIHIKFTDTRGGTELGFSVDRDALNLTQADFDKGAGEVHVGGDLMLDFTKVRCIADIDLETLTGQGYLQKLEA